jgi:anti-anti-sigma regulatory factor
VTLTQNEGVCLLRLEGEIGVATAAELKNLLLEGLAYVQEQGMKKEQGMKEPCAQADGATELRELRQRSELLVDLEQASELDVTAWQALAAAEREASRSRIAVWLAGPPPAPIAASALEIGFEHFPLPVRLL